MKDMLTILYIVFFALIAVSFWLPAKADTFYFEVGVGIHDKDRDSYETHSKKMGHAALGYEWNSGWFTEISHDSDLQDDDVGYDRLYVGHKWKF